MNIILQINLIVGTLLVLLFIVYMIKSNKVALKYSLTWILSAFFLLIISIFPKIVTFFADLLGIVSITNAIYFIAIAFLYIILFNLTIAITVGSERDRKIAQEIAFLRSEIEQLKAKQQQDQPKEDSKKAD